MNPFDSQGATPKGIRPRITYPEHHFTIFKELKKTSSAENQKRSQFGVSTAGIDDRDFPKRQKVPERVTGFSAGNSAMPKKGSGFVRGHFGIRGQARGRSTRFMRTETPKCSKNGGQLFTDFVLINKNTARRCDTTSGGEFSHDYVISRNQGECGGTMIVVLELDLLLAVIAITRAAIATPARTTPAVHNHIPEPSSQQQPY